MGRVGTLQVVRLQVPELRYLVIVFWSEQGLWQLDVQKIRIVASLCEGRYCSYLCIPTYLPVGLLRHEAQAICRDKLSRLWTICTLLTLCLYM
jgi:hypothetical protein